jgi:hypothetical protein
LCRQVADLGAVPHHEQGAVAIARGTHLDGTHAVERGQASTDPFDGSLVHVAGPTGDHMRLGARLVRETRVQPGKGRVAGRSRYRHLIAKDAASDRRPAYRCRDDDEPRGQCAPWMPGTRPADLVQEACHDPSGRPATRQGPTAVPP